MNVGCDLNLVYCLLAAASGMIGGLLIIILVLLRTWGRMEDTANLMFSISLRLEKEIEAPSLSGTVAPDSTNKSGSNAATNTSSVKPTAG